MLFARNTLLIDSLKNIRPEQWARLILCFLGIFTLATLLGNHYLYKTYAFEYGNYNFVLRDYAHLRVSKNLMYLSFGGDYTFMQDHFSFALFYFVPFYWLLNWFTGTYTLLLLQTLLLIASAWFVFLFVKKRTGNTFLGIFALVQYFLLQGRFSSYTGDVNIGIISACFVPFYLYLFEQKKYLGAAIVAILAVFARENMALWFVFIAVVQAYWYRKDRQTLKMLGFFVAAALLLFTSILTFFIPLFEIPGRKYALFEFSSLGKDFGSALLFILSHPWKSIKLLFVNHTPYANFDGVKFEFYCVYLISGAFLLLFRPVYLIWFLPPLALKMFNDSPIRWSIEHYYSVDFVTLLPISIALTLHHLNIPRFYKPLGFALLLSSLLISYYKSLPGNRELEWWGSSKESILNKDFFKAPHNLDVSATNARLARIPANSSISASLTLLPHLSQRDSIYCFPFIGNAKYVAFISPQKDNYIVVDSVYFSGVKNILKDPNWQILVNDEPLIILKRKN